MALFSFATLRAGVLELGNPEYYASRAILEAVK